MGRMVTFVGKLTRVQLEALRKSGAHALRVRGSSASQTPRRSHNFAKGRCFQLEICQAVTKAELAQGFPGTDSEALTPFKRILCANRGEIAIRVFRAGTEAGLQTVAIYSPADRLQPHRYKADESYCVGGPDTKPVACYLDVESIIQCAKQNDVDVIHPGYGFLSENSTFAKRCAEEGITFVGPRPETIEAMGDKVIARRLASECGVPVVPGTAEPVDGLEAARAFASEAGYPVMLKATMGGGGRGMRVVRSDGEMDEAFNRASNEAQAAFGDGRMFVEKYVEEPRHVEVQVLADSFGNVVHLYERECSVQRRHQKVVEVAPAPALDAGVRQRLHADAVKLAQHVHYCNAGTVEFMVDKQGNHFFLEVNPRIQVEHTVTEEVTGLDLVQSQIRVAGGASLQELGLGKQTDLRPPSGCAIQCRVTCEDPEQGFKPDTGRLEAYRVPGGPGVRLDGAVSTGNMVSQHYDSLLAKVITHAPTFATAVQKMQRALSEFQVRGVKTNLPFLENVLKHPEFMSGRATTSFIERNAEQLFSFEPVAQLEAAQILNYMGDLVVNGPNHPGAVGPAPSRKLPSPIYVPDHVTAAPDTDWKAILDTQGPAAWAKAVRAHPGALITDTTWRDAHQSLLATRMRTHDLLKAAPATSRILKNAASLECWGGATFDVAMRFLHEDPWRRLEQLREKVPNIPFQMLFRGANAVGYTTYPDNVVQAFCREAACAGIDIFRVFDSLNYLDNLRFGMDAVAAAGGVVEGTLCYTGDVSSPQETKYTLDYYLAMAEAVVQHGTHSLAIKDMAGVLKPRAAELLVGALRKQHPDVPIHVHTHDSAGTGVVTQLAAVAAGADIVDCCIDTMSGMTSQPAMGAIVNALAGTPHDTGVIAEHLGPLALFWEETRELYRPFESALKSTNSEVYRHEMPGGQYTNLKFQATSLGLGGEWHRVVDSFAAANRVLGNIIKVTPSSKVVGDLAQFMVQNDLDEHSVVERAEALSFPKSVVEFCQGLIGMPYGGVPEPFCSRVLRGREKVEGRPGASMPLLDLGELEAKLKQAHGGSRIRARDVVSAALYPRVFEELREFEMRFGAHIDSLPTRAFLAPMEEDEEIEMQMGAGKSLTVKYKAKGELQAGGKREVFFEVGGVPRVTAVQDRSAAAAALKAGVRDRADPGVLGSVGAPMAGNVVDVLVRPGAAVAAGQQLLVLSAMKMETAVGAPIAGTVQHLAVERGDSVDAGDLLLLLSGGTEEGPPSSAAGDAAWKKPAAA